MIILEIVLEIIELINIKTGMYFNIFNNGSVMTSVASLLND